MSIWSCTTINGHNNNDHFPNYQRPLAQHLIKLIVAVFIIIIVIVFVVAITITCQKQLTLQSRVLIYSLKRGKSVACITFNNDNNNNNSNDNIKKKQCLMIPSDWKSILLPWKTENDIIMIIIIIKQS